MNCELVGGCTYFSDLTAAPEVAAELRKRYCVHDPQNCARFVVDRTLGKEHVPPNLAPNEVERADWIIWS